MSKWGLINLSNNSNNVNQSLRVVLKVLMNLVSSFIDLYVALCANKVY